MTTREEKIRPVLIVSALNGWNVIVLAGLCAVAVLLVSFFYQGGLCFFYGKCGQGAEMIDE